MATPKGIIQALEAQLKASSYLSTVQDSNILVGARENVAQFPTIFIEPAQISESDIVYGRQRLTMRVAIVGISQAHDKDSQIDDLLDLENSIKQALSSDITLAGNAISLSVKETSYTIIEYPIRGCSITVEILLQQVSTTRS